MFINIYLLPKNSWYLTKKNHRYNIYSYCNIQRFRCDACLLSDVHWLEIRTVLFFLYYVHIYSGLKKQTTVYFCCIESQNRALLGKSMIHGETEEKSPYIWSIITASWEGEIYTMKIFDRKLRFAYDCRNSFVVVVIRPFNMHLDFWKSRSWKIKVCFKP